MIGMSRVRLEEIVVFVSDVQAAVAFYERVFGFRRVRSAFRPDHGAIVDLGGLRLAFQARALSATHGGEHVAKLDADAPPPPFELSFAIDDVDATYARALDGGADDLEPPHDTEWGDRIAHFRDPSGVLVGLSRTHEELSARSL